MSGPETVQQASVHGGRIVKPGDSVSLLPINERVEEEKRRDPEDGEYFAKEGFDSFCEMLGGSGPFPIQWIGRWRCGRDMLYIGAPKANGIGILAHEFV